MANVDSLSIQITASTKSAKQKVDALVASLNSLVTAINQIDTSKISALASATGSLGEGLSMLKGSNAKSITKVAEALNSVATTGKTAFDPIVEGEKKVEAETAAIAKETDKLAEGFASVDKTTLEDISSSAKNVAEGLGNTLNRVNSIKSSLKGIFLPTKSFESLEKQINKVADKYNELQKKLRQGLESGDVEEGSNKYSKMSAQLDALRNKYDELILKQKELAQEGSAIRLNPNVEKTLGAFKSGFTSVTNIVKNGFVAGIRTANSVLKSFKTRIRETLTSMKSSITSGHKATDMAKKFANELLRVSKMLKLMVTRMALRAVIKEVGNGFKSLALHSEEFNQSVSNMLNGSKKLGYAFASMVSPIINALAPAIVYVINLLTKLMNIINQIFSTLTGKTTWNKPKDFSENWADNIKAANKEAKELKKTVLGFDELNQMQEKYTSGGDTSGNIVDMFETVPIDEKWKNIGDWLKKMWEIGDFTELGKKLGEKLRDMLESIPWDLIRKTANKLGKSLATLINGFVEVERLGYDIGKTIAQSVNTVFEFLNGFVHNLHWDSIGKFIADTFNGFFENIDWPLIKDTVVTGMAGIAEAIQTFIEQFHWDNISQTIINGVDVIVSGVKAFVEGINWLELGQKMGEQIRKSIEGIDWKDIGEALGEIIQAAVDWVTGMLETLPSVETLVQAASDLLNGLFDKVDTTQMGENLAIILNNIYDFLVGFWAENGGRIKEEVKKFFKGFWDTIDKEDLKRVLGEILEVATLAGIAYALGEFAKLYVSTKLKQLITGAAGTAAAKGAAQTAGATLGGVFKAAFIGAIAIGLGNWLIEFTQKSWSDAILEGMRQAGYSEEEIASKKADLEYLEERYDGLAGKLRLLKDGFTGMKDIKLPSEELDNLKIKVEDLRTPVIQIQDDFDQFGNQIDKTTGDASKSLENSKVVILNYSNEWAGTKGKIIGVQKELTQSTTDSMNTIKKSFNDSSISIKKDTDDTTTTLSTDWQNAQKNLTDAVTGISTNTNKGMTDVSKSVDDSMKKVNESFDTVKKGMTKDNWTFSGVAEGLKKTFEDAKNGIKDVWNSIADKLNGDHEIGNAHLRIHLPRFAMGGFPEDGLFLANHSEMVGQFSNGKTAVANNAMIVEGISAGVYNAVSSAMARSGSGSERYIANTIVVDGEVIARTVTKAQERQNMRYSPNMG